MPLCHPSLPSWLLTDARLADHGLSAARCLPPGSAIIVRSDGLMPAARRGLIWQLRRIARARGLLLFVAGVPAANARRLGADGVHLRSRSAGEAARARRLGLITSAPVHNMAEAREAARAAVDHALISPLHPTRSHPGAATLGTGSFIRLAMASGAHPVALGGMNAARYAALMKQCGASPVKPGWAAIDAWNKTKEI
jgi:thiamine-phosphate pyrophosphorylase